MAFLVGVYRIRVVEVCWQYAAYRGIGQRCETGVEISVIIQSILTTDTTIEYIDDTPNILNPTSWST